MGFAKMLPVRLTEPEIKTKGERLSELVIEAVDVEDEKKAVNKVHADKLKEIGKEMRGLAREVRSGEEEREVDCEERPDHGRNIIEVMRMDTGEIVVHRPMDDGDRQRELGDIERTVEEVSAESAGVDGSEHEEEPDNSIPGGIGSEDEPSTETGLPG